MLVLWLSKIRHVVVMFLRFRPDPHLFVSPQMLFSSSGCAVVWQESETQRRPRWATSLRSNLSAITGVVCGCVLQLQGLPTVPVDAEFFYGDAWVHVKNQVTSQFRGEVEGTRCGSIGLVGAVVKMPLSWHALAKCGRLKQGSPCFSQDHWQIPWISLSVRWIEVRRCAERPCCDLEGDWVCSVAVARVVQDVVVCGVFCAC